MKKTILTLAIACSCTAMAADAQRIITFGGQTTQSDLQIDLYPTLTDGTGSAWGGKASPATYNGSDVTVTITNSNSANALWVTNGFSNRESASGTAWSEFSTFTGLSVSELLTGKQMSDTPTYAGGIGGSAKEDNVSVTLSDTSVLTEGSTAVFYVVAGSINGATNFTFSVTGLKNTNMSVAGTDGTWSTPSTEDSLTLGNATALEAYLIKVEGTLAGDSVTFSPAGGKSFLGTIAYGSTASPAVPEPASATMSLLALAGLCIRRRRKA